MTHLVIGALLGIAVLGTWLGCLGFVRWPAALDRLHCVAFINLAAGVPCTLAAFVADGASDRAFKILLILVISLLAGAATTHVTGRALYVRGDQ